MKLNLFIIFLAIATSTSFSQNNYAKIDARSKKIDGKLVDLEKIATHLSQNYTDDVSKIRAFYSWIAHNIQYDLPLMNSNIRYSSKEAIINDVLAKRKGVCQHYSELFLAMCHVAGIEAYVISGYTRDVYGNIAPLSHAWNAVRLDSGFYCIDATWASGYLEKGRVVKKFTDRYFLIPPKDFIKTHIPFDPCWQFLDNPITHKDFEKKNFIKLNQKGNFAFSDTIASIATLDSAIIFLRSNQRIVNFGVTNNMIKKQLSENNIQITNLQYNRIVDTINVAVDKFNRYVWYKNKRFKGSDISRNEIFNLIAEARKELDWCWLQISILNYSNSELEANISRTKSHIKSLLSSVQTEERFIEAYLKKP